MPPPNTPTFTAAEIEKMRLYVMEHDKQQQVNEFDLNNPPRVDYSHQHFPKVVYNLDAEGQARREEEGRGRRRSASRARRLVQMNPKAPPSPRLSSSIRLLLPKLPQSTRPPKRNPPNPPKPS